MPKPIKKTTRNKKKKSGLLSLPKFSKGKMIAAGIFFALLGGYFIYQALALTTSVTYSGALTSYQPTNTYSLTTGAGQLTATIKDRSRDMTVTIKNKAGTVIGTVNNNGARSASGSFNIPADTYSFTVSANGTINNKKNYNLTISYPLKESTNPTAIITSPLSGATVSGTTSIAATATSITGISKVEFLAGSTLVGTDTSSPYTASWNTTSVANGAITLTAKSYDTSGNIGQASVAVSVLNAAPVPDPAPTPAPTPPPTPTGSTFPTSDTAGVPATVTLKAWPSTSMRSDAVTGTVQSINGLNWTVYDGYLIDIPAGQYFTVTSGNVLFRNSRFVGHGIPSNTSALVQGGPTNMWFDKIDVLANGYARGIQSDTANITVTGSKFINTTNAGVEKNDRNMASDYTVTDNYISTDCSWTTKDPGSHTDGLQWGGARNVTVRNNTILVQVGSSCISNSAIGGWAELGNVNTATIDHNLLAGGGSTVYMEIKSPFTWNSASFTNNVFDRRWGGFGNNTPNVTSGWWCSLYPRGLPAQLAWSGNTWENGAAVSLADAKYGCV